MMRVRPGLSWVGLGMLGVLVLTGSAQAVSWEKYLLVVPLRAGDGATAKALPEFGQAFREVWAQAACSMPTVVFLKDDELASLQREYRLGDLEPEPALMERVADEKEIAIVYGSFLRAKGKLVLTCHVITGRNDEGKSYTVEGSETALRTLFKRAVGEGMAQLELVPPEAAERSLAALPGTDSWPALAAFVQALQVLKPGPREPKLCAQALPLLEKAHKLDAGFASAFALEISCRLTGVRPDDPKTLAKVLGDAPKTLEQAAAADPDNPWIQNARLEVLLAQRNPAEAILLGDRFVRSNPTSYRNYLLAAKAYRAADKPQEAEAVLLKGLDQQGTATQKKPFQLELGVLLLKRKDAQAEVYLRDVLVLEPNRTDLRYLRASALYRLGRHLDAMNEIQQAEAVHTWPALTQLKAMVALAAGNDFLAEGDVDRAYTYTAIASKLRPQHFETCLLFAKVLRKKELYTEARAQLELARTLADPKRARDHYLLGAELVSQGAKEEGANEFVIYLKMNPQAPERQQLIALIRKLRGQTEEEE
jgi:tetratricopeptide (TPR) repeat protein